MSLIQFRLHHIAQCFETETYNVKWHFPWWWHVTCSVCVWHWCLIFLLLEWNFHISRHARNFSLSLSTPQIIRFWYNYYLSRWCTPTDGASFVVSDLIIVIFFPSIHIIFMIICKMQDKTHVYIRIITTPCFSIFWSIICCTVRQCLYQLYTI